MCASHEGRTETVRLLLANDANPTIQDKNDFDALTYAGYFMHDDIAYMLREALKKRSWWQKIL